MDYRQTIAVLFELIFLLLFSMIFLKFQIYLHQKFSLSILFLCLTVFFIESIFYNGEHISIIFINVVYFSSSQLFYCLVDVLGKKYLLIYMDNIYLFLFKMGILGLIPLLIYDATIELFFDDKDSNYHGICTYFLMLLKNKDKIYLFVLDVSFGFAWEVSLWLTIYYFSPLHFIILEVMGEFMETTFNIIRPGLQTNRKEYSSGQIITFYIIYPIVIVCILIFNEIIILNFCNLNYNTRYYIIQRQKIDGIFNVDKNGNLVPVQNNLFDFIIDDERNDSEWDTNSDNLTK